MVCICRASNKDSQFCLIRRTLLFRCQTRIWAGSLDVGIASEESHEKKRRRQTVREEKMEYDFFTWDYQPQTKMKHMILDEYIDCWIKIVGSRNRLNYIDCFGGCGAYKENERIYFGSPILIAKRIEHNRQTLQRYVRLVIIEKDHNNVENLKKVFRYNNIQIEPEFIVGDFDEEINRILDSTKNRLAPTFFFVDPFGFTIKYSTLQRLMQTDKSEILLNFMYTRINQFLMAKNVENIMCELFGCEDWRSIAADSSKNREQELVSLYRRQLKRFARFVCPYRMSFADKERTYYYLFHLTNNRKGCTIMKAAFAKHNDGDVSYKGPRHGQMSLLDIKGVKMESIKKYLLDKYSNVKISFDDMIEENIDEVVYLEKEIRSALKELRDEGRIQVKPVTSRSKKGLGGKDMIMFG